MLLCEREEWDNHISCLGLSCEFVCVAQRVSFAF